MTPSVDLAAILALPPGERLAIAEAIWDSVGDDDAAPTPEQLAELERRLLKNQADPTAGTPWETVAVRVRESTLGMP